MPTKYMFNNAENMIDLARDIQIRVFWGGDLHLTDQDDRVIPWKDLWDTIAHEREILDAIGVEIKDDDVKFIYK